MPSWAHPNGRVGTSDSIRVLRLDPAIIGAGIESSLSKFDAILQGSISWNGTDRPVATSTDQIETGGMNIPAIVEQDVTPQMTLVKPLPQGGVAGITFSMPYQATNLPAAVNPSWRPDLQLSFEQPLLQGFGDEINQLRPNHPGSLITQPGITGLGTAPTAEGILITRVRFDQQRAELERNVQIMVTNTELAYWNLYYAYWNLYAQEQGLRFAYEAWRLSVAKFDAGKATIADVGQTRGQYESFRALRLVALNDVLDQERYLRGMLGMQGDDGKRLVPSDQPTLAPFRPDWETAQAEALAMRPEILLARQEVKVAQMNLRLQKDALLPDLRVGVTYDINGIGNRLDGPNSLGQTNALQNFASNHFNNYSAELRLNVPIGFRAAHANVRIAQLALARAMETLKDDERKITSFLIQQYRRVPLNYELIRVQRAARESYADQLRVRLAEYDAGKTVLDQLLEAQRFWANALSQEYLSIRDYNNALATFEFAKGTILARNNIVISEGMLPGFPQKRAVEHIAERNAALPIRERPNPIELSASAAHAGDLSHTTMESEAPSLPTMMGMAPPLKDAPMLPPTSAMPKPAVDTSVPASTTPTTTSTGTSSLPRGEGGVGRGVRCVDERSAGGGGLGRGGCINGGMVVGMA